ncbi:MAG: helix-turn-helix domain-containing protein [Saprospiraceae bacterium]|nr:helix-turn-helix domain-containing protein [Saprospiraceae bacterium]
MVSLLNIESPFIKNTVITIEEHLGDELFGVTELADKLGMSRSNLLKKIKKTTDLSASQFIRQVRLEHAMEKLRTTEKTVSEVAYEVGFASSSYFIKCFRELYGYPPGQVAKENDQFNLSRSHRLVAIMFTDIEGYTALMQEDESAALILIKKHRDVFQRITESFNGRVLQYYGDGTLSTFDSAIDAVKCGITMQKEFGIEPSIPVRIGIHSGDIIFSEDGVIGDGVNVASRIESLSVPHGVLISDKVYDEVKNQREIQTQSLGSFEFKNVGRPMEVFAISNEGLTVPRRDEVTGKLKVSPKIGESKLKAGWVKWLWVVPILGILGYFIVTSQGRIFSGDKERLIIPGIGHSIAALPFINDSNDSTNQYLINGLREAILNDLQKINGLRVVSRSSTEHYRHNPKPISEIAEELQVNYIIEGSGQKIGDRVVLNIQLIDAWKDKQVSGRRYDLVIDDVFQLQSQVALNIVSEIEILISPEEEQRLKYQHTHNSKAYDHFLKGQELINRGDMDGLNRSLPHFTRAIEEDDQYALAYAFIGIAYHYLDILRAEKIYQDSINIFADKALLMHPSLPQGLVAKAFYYLDIGKYEEALPYLEKAHEEQPGSSFIVNQLSDYYASYVPDAEKYLEYALKGIQLNPGGQDSSLLSFNYLHISNALIQSGFVEEAEKYINQSLVYDPGNLFAEYLRAYIIFAKNRNLRVTQQLLVDVYQKDTSRLDVIQEVAKVSYFLRDYSTALSYYQKFMEINDSINLTAYTGEYAKMAYTFREMGLQDESRRLFEEYFLYAQDTSDPYHHLSMAAHLTENDDLEEALDHLENMQFRMVTHIGSFYSLSWIHY